MSYEPPAYRGIEVRASWSPPLRTHPPSADPELFLPVFGTVRPATGTITPALADTTGDGAGFAATFPAVRLTAARARTAGPHGVGPLGRAVTVASARTTHGQPPADQVRPARRP